MNWMRLAMELTREAMNLGNQPKSEPEKPTDLGSALAQQFALIDRNMDAIVRMVNAHNAKLEATIRQQRIWNWTLAVGLLVTLGIAIAYR